jgi:hypothetical protein
VTGSRAKRADQGAEQICTSRVKHKQDCKSTMGEIVHDNIVEAPFHQQSTAHARTTPVSTPVAPLPFPPSLHRIPSRTRRDFLHAKERESESRWRVEEAAEEQEAQRKVKQEETGIPCRSYRNSERSKTTNRSQK